jgi:hypothetical protein
MAFPDHDASPQGHRPVYSLCVSLRWPPQQRAEFTPGLSYFRRGRRARDRRILSASLAILNDRRAGKEG